MLNTLEQISLSSQSNDTDRFTRRLRNQKILKEVLRFSFPTWPLQNTVAVNPFWSLRNEPFEKVMEKISHITGTSLMPLLSHSQELLKKGEISDLSLSKALQEAAKIWPNLPNHPDLFKKYVLNKKEQPWKRQWTTFAEYFEPHSHWNTQIISEVGKYAAAYLDEHQALAKFPSKEQSFFSAWLEAQSFDRTLETLGFSNQKTHLEALNSLDSEEAIGQILDEMGIDQEQDRHRYLEALLFSILGWSTQFTYLEWQKNLGYAQSVPGTPGDLLAVRLGYDFILYRYAQDIHPEEASKWLLSQSRPPQRGNAVKRPEFDKELSSGLTPHSSTEDPELPLSAIQYVCQLAWEMTYQKKLAEQIHPSTIKNAPRLAQIKATCAQMIFCIDVRSEMIRRHIEEHEPSIETLGFAGFFGLPMSYQRLDEHPENHRLPVLLKPSFKVHEIDRAVSQTGEGSLIQRAVVQSYLKSLRKGSLSSFAYVELFGFSYIKKMIHQSLPHLKRKGKKTSPNPHFDDTDSKPNAFEIYSSQGDLLPPQALADRLADILTHMGLTSHFAELVLMVGHGSATTNNAWSSSLECGACGGHAGDINVRLLTTLFNRSDIRLMLKEKSIEIPESTHFIAALHETVSDEILILDQQDIPSSLHLSLNQIQEQLSQASATCQIERQSARTRKFSPAAKIRSKSWSEVRPEWGLAGNASFLIASRSRSRGINLGSRTFLHDYQWNEDEKKGYRTLELIMTAPMIVTNWINLQYYASTVAPQIYGSGNKVIHNLVNESGMIEGNGGDLRVGLSLQSIHDGSRWVHDPLRLSVFIEAPKEPIEMIIQKHEVVRDLIKNGWLHLLQINPETGITLRRTRDGQYQIP